MAAMNYWLMLAMTSNPDLFGPLLKMLVPFLVVIFALKIIAEIFKSERRKRTQRKREMSRENAQTIVVMIAGLVFFGFEFWLWKCKGLGGRILAVVIPIGIVALVVYCVLRRHRRKNESPKNESSNEKRGDNLRYPFPPREAEGPTDENVAIRKGEMGEALVREELKSLPSNRYVVLHNVWLPMDDGGETQIDHVVVSRFGIFIIETKNWKGTIYANAKSPVWTKYNSGHKTTHKNPIHQNYKHIVSVREKFSRSGSDFVFGIVAMSPLAEFKGGVPKGVVFYNELQGWILGHVEPCIKPEQISDIVSAIQEWSSTVSEAARRHHCGQGN